MTESKKTGLGELRYTRSRTINDKLVGVLEESILVNDVAVFDLRFLSEEGGWEASWSSVNELPIAAELRLMLVHENTKGELVKKDFLLTVNIPSGGKQKQS